MPLILLRDYGVSDSIIILGILGWFCLYTIKHVTWKLISGTSVLEKMTDLFAMAFQTNDRYALINSSSSGWHDTSEPRVISVLRICRDVLAQDTKLAKNTKKKKKSKNEKREREKSINRVYLSQVLHTLRCKRKHSRQKHESGNRGCQVFLNSYDFIQNSYGFIQIKSLEVIHYESGNLGLKFVLYMWGQWKEVIGYLGITSLTAVSQCLLHHLPHGWKMFKSPN